MSDSVFKKMHLQTLDCRLHVGNKSTFCNVSGIIFIGSLCLLLIFPP